MLVIYKETSIEFAKEIFTKDKIKEYLDLNIKQYFGELLNSGYISLVPSIPDGYEIWMEDGHVGMQFEIKINETKREDGNWTPGIEKVLNEFIEKAK